MIEKEKILEAWIMVEHLSEGDIRLSDKSLLTLADLQEQDFYALFQREMAKKNITSKKKGGIVLYFDIFGFREVVSLLREQYRLAPTNEEIQFGSKFSFALYFDKDLNFLSDMTFFTESAYIRYFKKVPHQEEFREFEDDLKQAFTQDFDGTAASRKKFNEAVQKELQRYGIDVKNCRMQVLSNVETEGTNLHSFFIGDLEKAKSTDTENLRSYLYGHSGKRVNLDSKSRSGRFNPRAFEEILQPKNYPLGRFPSKTKFALSLMQQVAVNLSIGADPQPVRSVNGPPGTGKTTLLKDIFAQLVVQQAYDIAKLPEHTIKGTEETVYFNNASIGVIPAHITENHIVVASSNNGAVQNIVNELPLCQGIEETLLEDLKAADYFREISNAKVSSQWQKDEDGKNREELTLENGQGEETCWGVFSLEGGKSDNMTNILTHIKHMNKYLEEEYLPPAEDVYKAFLAQYEEVRSLRAQVQAAADSIQAQPDHTQRLEQVRASYQEESARRRKGLEAGLREQGEIGRACGQRLQELQRRLEEVQSRKETAKESRRSLALCLDMLKEQKPGLFSEQEQRQYINRLGVISDQLMDLSRQDASYIQQEGALRREIGQCQAQQRQSAEKQASLQNQFAVWAKTEEAGISSLEKKVRECAAVRDRTRIEPLNMAQEYDALQLSNPWFDEAYRVAQSKLFLAALSVRKHFLFENRRNLRAAVSIWSQQEKYVDRAFLVEAAWNWINMAVPVISSTFASFSRMCRHLGPETLGHLFIDEAGQARPQAAVGAVFRSRHVMVVGDPSQIKPVLTLDSNTLSMLGGHFGVTEKYLSASASAQTLTDAASRYGFYRRNDSEEDAWIGIPLWVHRRCQCPMFDISNKISYDGLMVQGMTGSGKYGKTGWFDVGGKASNKYVEEQGEFLVQKIRELMKQDPRITDKDEKDVIYVITPFSNAAYQLSQKLRSIGFTRYDAQGKPSNVGTVHTFQGKEAPIVFFVLGADKQSSGAAQWAVNEPNMMNVAATRAKKEFYIIGDRQLYLSLRCDVANDTDRIIRRYKVDHPELVEDTVNLAAAKKAEAPPPKPPVPVAAPQVQTPEAPEPPAEVRITGTVKYVGRGRESFFAYVSSGDGIDYTIPESIFSKTERAAEVIRRGRRVSFIPKTGKKNRLATDIKPAAQENA